MAHMKNQECIRACEQCAEECEHCASACLQEQDVKMMSKCIALDRDCADICGLAARWMARGSDYARSLCRLCAEVCRACAADVANIRWSIANGARMRANVVPKNARRSRVRRLSGMRAISYSRKIFGGMCGIAGVFAWFVPEYFGMSG